MKVCSHDGSGFGECSEDEDGEGRMVRRADRVITYV
jgi:hypothetical protein